MNNEQKTKLEKAKALLNERRAACAVVSGAPYIYFGRGVQPLLTALEEGRLAGACVADRVIGKGAAMLLVCGGAAAVHASLISAHAKTYLDRHQIEYSSDQTCPYIINRTGNGMCPMESTVLEIEDPYVGVAAMRQKLKELSEQ